MDLHKPVFVSVAAGLVALGTLVAGAAHAVSLSNLQGGAWIGQALDLALIVRTDGGQPDCVQAEVSYGDQRVPPALVRTSVEAISTDVARIRVASSPAVDEPVVSVSVSVGCGSKVARRYTVFAEPPGYAAVLAPAAASSSGFGVNGAGAASPGSSPTGAAGGAGEATQSGAGAFAPAASGVSASGAGSSAGTQQGPAAREAALAAAPRVARKPNRAVAAAAVRSKPVADRAGERTADKPAAALAGAAPTTGANPARNEERRLLDQTVAAAGIAAPAAGPRLRLDMVQPSTQTAAQSNPAEADAVSQALAAVQEAASSARAAAIAASAAALRITSLERTVERLKGEAKASTDLNEQLRVRLREAGGPGLWFWPLLAFALAMGGVAAWLMRRVLQLQKAREQTWVAKAVPQAAAADAAAARLAEAQSSFFTAAPTLAPGAQASLVSASGSTSGTLGSRPAMATAPTLGAQPAPASASFKPTSPSNSEVPTQAQDFNALSLEPVSELSDARREFRADRSEPWWAQDAALRGAPQAMGFATGAAAAQDEGGPLRPVSIEELLDLEQQAEFFVVLGQDHSAIDLLVEHLRSTGGGSPLPYLKLLEIYRRLGDREHYERMRSRFNHRFNAYAPQWGADLNSGRSLDAYPGVLPKLQQLWAKPVDAMAELEAMLFGKSRGELFDLPAYREVLFLYGVARDLMDAESSAGAEVDFLLPIMPAGRDFNITAPSSLDAPSTLQDTNAMRLHGSNEDLPTTPLDLDVTAPARPRSIFDPLGEDTRIPSPLPRR